ncbi:MAG: hypothetical protein IT244_08485 [Bacteroidia bacterium]|nr:hypothetical protein [Bacteroidia bacterium]
MKSKRLLLTINICLCSLFVTRSGFCQTHNGGVSFWATTGPNYSILYNSDFVDDPFGSMVIAKPGWHLGFSTYVPFTFTIPHIKSKLLFTSGLEVTQVRYQYDKDLSGTHYKSNSNVFTANIGLGKQFRLTDKFGIRFSVQQGIYAYKINHDSKEKIYLGSNKFEISTIVKIKKRRVSLGFSSFAGPQSYFEKRNDSWIIGELKGKGYFVATKFRAIQLDLGIQLWSSKK